MESLGRYCYNASMSRAFVCRNLKKREVKDNFDFGLSG